MPSEKPDSFQVGAFEVVRNPDVRQFADKLNRLREAVDQCRLQDGVGYTVSRSSGGTVLSIKTGTGGGVPETTPHPFQVSVRLRNGRPEVRVLRESLLVWTGGESREVSGLGEWLPAEERAGIWLEAKVRDGYEFLSARIAVSTETLQSFGQDAVRVRLAVLGEANAVVQNVRFNLQALNACRNGQPGVVFSSVQEF